jgi:hypothetical protein
MMDGESVGWFELSNQSYCQLKLSRNLYMENDLCIKMMNLL